jgi:hypothetical protein
VPGKDLLVRSIPVAGGFIVCVCGLPVLDGFDDRRYSEDQGRCSWCMKQGEDLDVDGYDPSTVHHGLIQYINDLNGLRAYPLPVGR